MNLMFLMFSLFHSITPILFREYSRKLTALENTAVPKCSIFSLPPFFSGFFTYFLYSFRKFSNPY